jgi:hypothetical protein
VPEDCENVIALCKKVTNCLVVSEEMSTFAADKQK